MRFDGVMVLGKELRRDRHRALRELRARSAAASIAFREGARGVVAIEAPLQGQEEAGSVIVLRFVTGFGVPAERVILDERTRSTREEAVEGLRVADEQGWERLLVVTSVYHIPRATRYFEEVMGRERVAVLPPEALLSRANAGEREAILAGTPQRDAMADECRVEALLSGLARALRPVPAPLRWDVEVWAGGLYRGLDAARRG